MTKNSRFLLQIFMVLVASGQFLSACNSIQTKDERVQEDQSWLKPGMLNSQRIEAKFHSYGVELLAQDIDAGTRLSSLLMTTIELP